MASNAPVPATARDGPLSAFERLSKIAYLYRPKEQSSSSSSSSGDSSSSSSSSRSPSLPSPKLILVAGWMDAREPHLAKYTAKLQALFPASPILLLRSFAQHFTAHVRHLHSDLAPAVPLLQSLAGARDDNGHSYAEMLALCFSNGGSKILAELYTLASPCRFPRHAKVLDSAPGRFQWMRGVTAFSMPAARSTLIVRLLAVVAAHCLCAVYWLGTAVLGRAGVLEQCWAAHNDPAVNSREVQRVYIYSKEDALVDYQDVQQHAAEAEVKGFGPVRLEEFAGTAHVAHARGDEARYWLLVEKTWEEAAGGERR